MGRPVLGTAEIVGSLPREAIRGYLREHYSGRAAWCWRRPAQVDHDALVELAAQGCSATLPQRRARRRRSRRAMPAATAARRAISSRCIWCWASPASAIAIRDYYAASVLSTLLGGGMSSRLFQEVREKRGLVYTIYTFASLLPRRRPVRHLCRHRRGRGRGAAARWSATRCARLPTTIDGRGSAPRARAAQGRHPDVAREHRAPAASSWRSSC